MKKNKERKDKKRGNVLAAYFSPAGTTKKVTLALGEGLAEALGVECHPFDFTLQENREWRLEFEESDYPVIGLPTYAGRLPNKIMPYVRDFLFGETTPVIPVVTYGGRSFDDALAELACLLNGNGFFPVAALSAVGEHAMCQSLQKGRPTEEELKSIRAFGREAGEYLLGLEGEALEEAAGKTCEAVPGNPKPAAYYRPVDLKGEPTDFLKAKPLLRRELCTDCGICLTSCPVDSIHKKQNPLIPSERAYPSVEGLCIKCHSCLRRCPEKAWYFADEALSRHVEMLEVKYGDKNPKSMGWIGGETRILG